MANVHPPEATDALLSAFLDGELDAVAEQELLCRLEQEPALQDALDELAQAMAATRRALHDDGDDIDVLAAVLAGLPADDVADSVEGAETLAWLVADGAADDAQHRRLDTLLNQYPDETAEAVAFLDATRATLNTPAEVVAGALSRLPDHVGARVARTERAWSLSAGAADGALNAAEIEELVGLCSDHDLAATFEATVAARVDAAGVHRGVTEVLAAFAASPEVEHLAARAGAAALQVIAAEAAQSSAVRTTTTTTTAPAIGVWAKIRGAFGQGFIPLVAASAAAVAFVVVDRVQTDPGSGNGRDGAVAVAAIDAEKAKLSLAEFRDAFVETVGLVAMANNTVLPDGNLPVIADNGADVETLDAAGTTMVFQTAESNITVIWVAGLDDDSAEEQGT